MTNEWVYPKGTLTAGEWESVVDASIEGWEHTGFRTAALTPGASVSLDAGPVERVLVPLAGQQFTVSYRADHSGPDSSDPEAATASAPDTHVPQASDAPFTVLPPSGSQDLAGRSSVFHGPADALYLPCGTSATITSPTGGKIAVAEAPTTQPRPVQHLPKAKVSVELRGAGRSSRQVHNFATPAGLDCVKIIACEVITPAENWSSYPAHKHDEAVPGKETQLEEIYYFESAVSRGVDAPPQADPFAFFASYDSPAGAIDTAALVRTGDVALVPHGYHGPLAAAPGYDNYYLNVMAGPGDDRLWLISDDPAHGWVRAQWEEQEFDSRLPYAEAADQTGTTDSQTPGAAVVTDPAKQTEAKQ